MRLSVVLCAGLFIIPTLVQSQHRSFSIAENLTTDFPACYLLGPKLHTLGHVNGQLALDVPTVVGPYTPTHTTGFLSNVNPLIFVGPDAAPSTSPNTWAITVNSNPLGADTKFLVLHFTDVNLPGTNRLEIDLNYDPPEKDVFHTADGADLWTRPINIGPLAGAPVVVRYITDGTTNTGKVRLAQIGVGQPVNGRCGARSNSDPFLLTTPFVEPTYDPFWFCSGLPKWENTACVDSSDVRARVARSVGMIVGPTDSNTQLSTCSVTLVDTDKVILAGHCINDDAEALASSVVFDYQTDCNGNRPQSYSK
jgi:hypothetical protein